MMTPLPLLLLPLLLLLLLLLPGPDPCNRKCDPGRNLGANAWGQSLGAVL
jgi:hypothetical protein